MKKKRSSSKKKKTKFSFYKLIILILSVSIFLLIGFIGGYILNENKSQTKIKQYQNTLKILEQKVNKLSKELKKTNQYSKKHLIQNSEILDLLNSPQKIKKSTQIIKNTKMKINKPKLVIIIDDMAFKYEVNLLKQIPYHITPSFFPVTKRHPFTPLYAKEFPDYMVHVPMQAFNYAHPEPNTLQTNSSFETIQNRINIIKKEFPRAKFINNHTGSKFTSNFSAMSKLFEVLKEDNLGFVDSMTTRFSKSEEVDKIYKIPLFKRDIFLDDKENPDYIRNQLKKAIEIAKRRGYAIAIGHPHKITLETLKNSKDLLNQVDVIYIDELAKICKKLK